MITVVRWSSLKNCWPFFLIVFIYLFTCFGGACTSGHVSQHVCVEAREGIHVSSVTFCLILMKQNLSLVLEEAIWFLVFGFRCCCFSLVSKLQLPSYLCTTNSRVTGSCNSAWLFNWFLKRDGCFVCTCSRAPRTCGAFRGQKTALDSPTLRFCKQCLLPTDVSIPHNFGFLPSKTQQIGGHDGHDCFMILCLGQSCQ